MKKYVCMMIAVLLLSQTCAAFAEEPKGNFFGSVGSFFSNAWNDVSEWTGNAWGDASKWVSQAWSDSSSWVSDIWGDASEWASDTYSSVSETVGEWWNSTFSGSDGSGESVWAWLSDETVTAVLRGNGLFGQMADAVSGSGDAALNTAVQLLSDMGFRESDTEKIRQTVESYAQEKEIDAGDALKIALPYLLKLDTENASGANGSIPAVAVAQYLTMIFEKDGMTGSEEAKGLVEQLAEVLKGI